MNRIAALILFIGLIVPIAPLSAQEDGLKMGLGISPHFSWLGTNDVKIQGQGSRSGVQIMILGEQYFKENYAISGRLGLTFGQGGTIRHEVGGNFWPNSDLNDPKFNRGQKPMPEGTELEYNLTYLEAQVGLKMKTNRMGIFRYYAEIPFFSLGMLTGAKGDINAGGVQSKKNKIGKEVRNLVLSWGVGVGFEFDLEDGPTLIGGVYYQQSLNDITRNQGYKALSLTNDNGTPEDPFDDQYETTEENSQGRVRILTIRIGILL